ncbi:hypothetical protein TcWFU_002884 [Taenia crassiceps]|uniref:Uncharacterized protein n=1 Tax=Taenia crassiceps TaxID=6207 RepID=A0ABR4Q1W3_9CEST
METLLNSARLLLLLPPPTDKPSLTIMATQSPAPNPLLLSISSFRPLSEEDTCRLTTHHTRCEPSNFTEVAVRRVVPTTDATQALLTAMTIFQHYIRLRNIVTVDGEVSTRRASATLVN